jgi:hypothetical protein
MASKKRKRSGAIFKKPKARRVMGEFGQKTLRHGSTGEIVTDPKMAAAIAASEQRKADAAKRRRRRR